MPQVAEWPPVARHNSLTRRFDRRQTFPPAVPSPAYRTAVSTSASNSPGPRR
jgi:hypothetical protein